MDTRLRSFARNSWVKAVSFLLCVAFALGAVAAAIWMGGTELPDDHTYGSNNYFDFLTLDSFYGSQMLYTKTTYIMDAVLDASGWITEDTDEVMAEKDRSFERLGAIGGVYYWVSTKHMVLSNTEPNRKFFTARRAHLILDGHGIDAIKSQSLIPLNYALESNVVNDDERRDESYGTTLYICIEDELLSGWENEFNTRRAEAWRHLGLICLLALLSLVCFIHLILTAGRGPGSDETRIWWLDRVYWEVQIALIAINAVILAVTMEQSGGSLLDSGLIYWVSLVPLGLCWMLFIELTLSVAKRIKRREFWRGSLCLILLRAVWVAVKSFCVAFASSMPLSIMAAGCVALLSISVAATFYAPVVAVLFTLGAMVITVLWLNGLTRIIKGVKAVKAGKLDTVITLKGKGKLTQLAEDINGISEGLQARVESELRAERMKTELITNVSHDLRTPLTSVLTYVDLLKTEGLNSPDAPHYLEVVEQKSARLKQLTDDLFEAAKASSGSITPVFEDIELRELVDQSLGELSGKIEERGLDFRVSGENVRVRADGRMLWRCLENLLGNIFKYAFSSSRVYVTIEKRDGVGLLTIKNISAYELEADASELTERFTRGDSARGGEGSGLGLAIVKDFVRLQKGSFNLEVDGDLFKTIIALPLA